jgi:hypothetical protein
MGGTDAGPEDSDAGSEAVTDAGASGSPTVVFKEGDVVLGEAQLEGDTATF